MIIRLRTVPSRIQPLNPSRDFVLLSERRTYGLYTDVQQGISSLYLDTRRKVVPALATMTQLVFSRMAVHTECDEVLQSVVAQLASGFLMMNL